MGDLDESGAVGQVLRVLRQRPGVGDLDVLVDAADVVVPGSCFHGAGE